MKIFQKLFVCVLLLLSIIEPTNLKAEDITYYVYDAISNFQQFFKTYNEAYSFYKKTIDEFDNLVLRRNDEIIHMEYGIVEFNSDEACSITIEYHSIDRNTDAYHNGCYGIDGAYLYTSENGNRVYYILAGEKAYTDINNVRLVPYELVPTKLSSYINSDNKFYHNIKTQMKQDYYSYSLELDDALSFLAKNKEYYSYDGHYFYDDFYKMIDDYKDNQTENAVNEIAYYNYYQYLPHRSISNYTVKELEDYFYNTLGINNKLKHYTDYNYDLAADEINRSQLFMEIDDFFVYQYMYGTNALMLISSAINESSYGKSLNSFITNNLYSVAAYESQIESDNNRYSDVSSSIYGHSKYIIASLYSNYRRSSYAGTFFGDKLAGINTTYSLDPYYGVKCAATYRELDKNNGLKDKDSLALGIIKDRKSVTFYRDESLKNRLFILDNINELVFVILNETDNAYKIQIDSTNLDDYLYSFDNSIAYVSKDVFKYILNEDKIHEYSLKTVNYDFNEGEFKGYTNLSLSINEDEELLNIDCKKDGYELIGFDENGKAEYVKIKSIELKNDFNHNIELYQNIDFGNCLLHVVYEDNTSKDIPLNSSMISYYDNSIEGIQDITISYCGLSIDSQIQFTDELLNHRLNIAKAIEDKDYRKVKEELSYIKYPLNFSQIRNIDYDLKQLNNRNYVINDKTERYNLSISGLDLSLDDKKVFSFIDDTYYVVVNDISIKDREEIYEFAKGYGFQALEGIDISFRFNYEDIKLKGPAIVQIDLADKKINHVYSVYHLTKDNDIVKCRTTQSENYIQFMILEEGPYLVLSMPSVNEYDLRDNTEDLSYENMGYDNHKINFSLMALSFCALLGITGIIVYYIFNNKRKKSWRDFKRSLRLAGSVQEEKLNN